MLVAYLQYTITSSKSTNPWENAPDQTYLTTIPVGNNLLGSAFYLRLGLAIKNIYVLSHLICTLIFEDQGLEKLRSVSNLKKISGPAHLDFFSVCHLDFFQVYGINLAFFSRWRPRKKSRFAGPEIFLRFETDLDFQKSRCRLKGRICTR